MGDHHAVAFGGGVRVTSFEKRWHLYERKVQWVQRAMIVDGDIRVRAFLSLPAESSLFAQPKVLSILELESIDPALLEASHVTK